MLSYVFGDYEVAHNLVLNRYISKQLVELTQAHKSI